MESPLKPRRHSAKMIKQEFSHRLSEPQTVLQVWKCVNTIRHQRQKPTPDRLQKFIIRELDVEPAEADKILENLVHDGMLLVHGSTHKYNKGLMEDAYTVPSREEVVALHGSHDWYCFACHKAGEDTLACDSCWRVYHERCVAHDTDTTFVCNACKSKSTLGIRELNRLLGFTVSRLKERTRELYHVMRGPQHEELVELFVHKQMDLGKMQEKVKRRLYRTLEEFHADAQLVLHNIILVYGEKEDVQLAPLARVMIKDCVYDLDEIRLCKDCYFTSNARPKDWFCVPCKIPHELVYAKQKGFSYWPAKVIKVTSTGFDVRFFGRLHQRATVPKSLVHKVEAANIAKLVPKRTSSFAKACQELAVHQEKLVRYAELRQSRKDQGLPSDEDDEAIPSDEDIGPGDDDDYVEEGVDDRDQSTLYDDGAVRGAPGLDETGDSVLDASHQNHAATHAENNEAVAIPPSKKFRRDDRLGFTPSDEDRVTSSDDHKIKSEPSPRTPKIAAPKNRRSTPLLHKKTVTTTPTVAGNCNCKEKLKKEMTDLRKELKQKFTEEKAKALREQSARLRKDFEQDKQQAVSRAMANIQREVDKAKRQVEDTLKPEYLEEMKKLAQKHHEQISATKKKQWCFNCEQEAMYHCCWNTSYCSTKCQQEHWHREHKRVCRRKR